MSKQSKIAGLITLLLLIAGLLVAVAYKNNWYSIEPQIKPFPNFTLSAIDKPGQFTKQDFTGEIKIVRVWASWCEYCKQDHHALKELAQQFNVPLYGVIWMDDAANAKKLLEELGSAYTLVLNDVNGDLGFKLGLKGVPYTAILNSANEIVYSTSSNVNSATFGNYLNKAMLHELTVVQGKKPCCRK